MDGIKGVWMIASEINKEIGGFEGEISWFGDFVF